jgi:tetratricopeptide (TPR) repeat protein
VSGGSGIKSDAINPAEWSKKMNKKQRNSVEGSSGNRAKPVNSNIKIVSPISILDNNTQFLRQMTADNQQIQKQDSQNSMNLTQQIRKTNKIQIRKRFQQESQQEQFPEILITQAKKLLEQNEQGQALEKFLEYIKVQPLDSKIHFEIGVLYFEISNDGSA